MNNEEKILQLLEQVIDDQKSVHAEITDMRTEITGMRTEITDIRDGLTRVAIGQENVVLPRLQLLYEGQVAMQEQIKRITLLDRMQDDISVLKSAVKYLSTEIEAIKSAG